MRKKIKNILESEEEIHDLIVKGWIRTKRDSKGFSFLEINDGSCLSNLQVIADADIQNYEVLENLGTGSAVAITGDVVESPGKGQKWELRAREVELLGGADPATYPLQKKRHSDEFLRSIAHLRPRTNKYGAMTRIRSETCYAVHKFFRDRGFFYVQTPIITGSDCEGAGELFQVTALDLNDLPLKEGKTDLERDFFGCKAALTVSGQLSAESLACALGDVYTFGPTFRAEDSNTPRHAAEFWMIEPEMAFADLQENMDVAEEFTKEIVSWVRENRAEDFNLFARFVDKKLAPRLDTVLDNEFARLPYTEAIQVLQNAPKKFDYPVDYGSDLQTEHERYLSEEYLKRPVFIYDYPREIKPFYMRVNADRKTVGGMDLLVPGIGELIGGSQREERLDVLGERMKELGLNKDDYWWYLDLRRFGSVPHSGFGLGFERFLMLLTGVSNIRDVISFPRTPRNLEF